MNALPNNVILFADIVLDEFGGMSPRQIRSIPTDKNWVIMQEEIDVTCRVCEREKFRAVRLLAGKMKCPSCCDAHELEALKNQCRVAWERLAPRMFRETDVKHPDFPKGIWKELKASWDLNESLVLYGPTGAAKTRVAMLLLQWAMFRGKTVDVIWPEELVDYAKGRDRLNKIKSHGSSNVLLLDDALLTGAADERVASFVKDIIDFSQRNGNSIIITTQVGGEAYKEAGDKWENATKADRERIEALLRRIRQVGRVIPFAQPDKDEESF